MKSVLADVVLAVAAATVFFLANLWRLERKDQRQPQKTRDQYIGRS